MSRDLTKQAHLSRSGLRADAPKPPATAFRSFLAKSTGIGGAASSVDTLIVYGLLAGLLLGTLLLGMRGVGMARLLFILGSLAVAWRANRVGPALHIEVVIILFSFAPFLRRMVDLNAGFNASGVMLVAPLLAMAIPLSELRNLIHQHGATRRGIYIPYAIMIACLTYGWAVSAFQGDIMSATTLGMKLFIPLFYAMFLMQRVDDCEVILAGAARALLFVSPIMSAYGIWQFMAPQPWDRVWMLNTASKVNAMGLPEAQQIRVFSTMNSPVSFAAFVSCGMLLLGFCRRGWLSIALLALCSVGMLLSSVRGAWMAIAIGVVFCMLFSATRGARHHAGHLPVLRRHGGDRADPVRRHDRHPSRKLHDPVAGRQRA